MNSLIKALFAFTFLSGYCSCTPKESLGPIEKILSSSDIQPKSKIVFLVLNPDDCPSCYGNASLHFNYLTDTANFPPSNLFVVTPDMRQKVKEHFFTHVIPFDTTQHMIIEDSHLANELKRLLKEDEAKSSCLVVYSPEKQFIQARLLKRISSHEELMDLVR